MKTIKVLCAIIEKEGKTLAVQRSSNMSLPFKWEFPGGKLEKSETELECIVREIYEELNLLIKPTKRLMPNIHSYEEKIIELIPYKAIVVSGELVLNEHSNYSYLEKAELFNLDWAEADIPIVQQIINF